MPIEDEVLKQLVFWLWISLGAMIEFLIVFLCYWLIPMERRSRFLSFLTKRSYGVVEVVGKGKKITKHLVNLFEDFATVRGGVYVLDPAFVYTKDGAPVIHYDEKNAFEPRQFTSDVEVKKLLKSGDFKNLPKGVQEKLEKHGIKELRKILEESGEIKKIYLRPISMKADRPKKEIFDPQMVNAIFLKQKALAESEALVKVIRMLKMLLLAALACAAVAAALSFMNYDLLSGGDVLAIFGKAAG